MTDQKMDAEMEFVDHPALFIGTNFFNQKEGKKYFEGLKKSTIATRIDFRSEFDGWDLALDALRQNQNITECHFSLSYLSGSFKALAELLSFSKFKKFHLLVTPQLDKDEELFKLLYKQVANAIKDNHYIEEITIGSWKQGCAFEEDMTLLFDSVKAHPTIKRLNVISCGMNGDNMKMIADIVNNSNITALSLTGNATTKIDDNVADYTVDVVEHLIELTRVNKNLTCLRLEEGFAGKSARYLLDGLVLSNNRSLEELHLNQIDGSEKYLGQFLTANLPIKIFGMRSITLSKEHLPEIIEGLEQNTHIKKMEVMHNDLVVEVLRVLKNHRSITDIDIRNSPLDLRDNTADLVTDILKNNKILRALHFQTTNDSLNTILDSLKHNQSITDLTLQFFFRKVDLTALTEMLKVNQSLTKLTLQHAGPRLGGPDPEIHNPIVNVIQPFTERNKLAQRLNTTNTLQTIAMISKSKSFLERLPKDMWRLVFSYISYPGVAMDFSSKI